MNGGAVAAWEKSPGKSQEEIAALQRRRRRRRRPGPAQIEEDDQNITSHQFRASEQPQDGGEEQNARANERGRNGVGESGKIKVAATVYGTSRRRRRRAGRSESVRPRAGSSGGGGGGGGDAMRCCDEAIHYSSIINGIAVSSQSPQQSSTRLISHQLITLVSICV